MCKKVNNKKIPNTRIDVCIKPFIKWLKNKHILVASCCGHGKYPLTVIVKEGISMMPIGQKNKIVFREIISQKIIPRTRNFYKKDSEGYYYIPEVEEHWKKQKKK